MALEAERLGGLEIYDQLVLGRRLHRQVGGLLALEDAIDVAGRAPVLVDEIRPIGHQAAGGDEQAVGVDSGQSVPGGERDDQIAVNLRQRLAVTIRPPFEARAKAAMARSISPASRTLTGVTSTPSDGAAAWIAPNWPVPAAYGGIPKDRHARHVGRDLLEQFQPFAADAVFEAEKPVVLPPGRARLSTKPPPTGSTTLANTIGTVRVACCNGPTVAAARARMTSGASATNSAAYLRMSFGIARGPAIVDPHVAAVGPAQLLQALQERREQPSSASSPSRPAHEHADAPHRARAAARAPRAAMPPPRRRAA